MKKIVTLIMLVTVVGAFVAGCSGGSSDAGSTDKTAAPAAGTK